MMRWREKFTWSALLWAVVYPRRRHRTVPTVSGVVLIGLALGIGTAAYNAANNILFITLALLLACLLLSGVLSWWNLRGVTWRLRLPGPLRAAQETVAVLRVHNRKEVLPTYALRFELAARSEAPGQVRRAETTFTARGAEVRAALAQAEVRQVRGELALLERLDPGEEVALEWSFRPAQRGRLRAEVSGVVSLFPFGFLRKRFAAGAAEDVVVWPRPADYRRLGAAVNERLAAGRRTARAGSGSDLLALRRYELGDSHRLIHWKASARTRRLLVRQFAAESVDGVGVWLQTDAARWTGAEQFERLVSFAATLAEDLFRAGLLTAVALDRAPPRVVRRVRDLEAWLDQLAVVAADERAGTAEAPGEGSERRGSGRGNWITFAPDGPRGVAAYLDGERFAAA